MIVLDRLEKIFRFMINPLLQNRFRDRNIIILYSLFYLLYANNKELSIVPKAILANQQTIYGHNRHYYMICTKVLEIKNRNHLTLHIDGSISIIISIE